MASRRRAPDEAVICECEHSKHSHERDRETLQWNGQCHAQVVTELAGGGRAVKECTCERFKEKQRPDESGPCRIEGCGMTKYQHRGRIGHSYAGGAK